MRDPRWPMAHKSRSSWPVTRSIAEPAPLSDTRAMVIPAALTIVFVALVLGRLVALRRLGTPRPGSVWLFYTPQFLAPVALLVAGLMAIATMPLIGLGLALVGLGYGALVVRMVRRIARAAATATTSEELANAAIEPTAHYMLTMTVLGVMGLIAFGVLAIIWAVASR